MKKILFITAHRKDRAPNQRFRFEQYFSFLNQNGFECTLAPLIATVEEDRVFYAHNPWRKALLGTKLTLRRLNDIFRSRSFDIIFIAREAYFAGTTFFENQLSRGKAKIVFDFDDAIWMDTISKSNSAFSWLKDGKKTQKIIQIADTVIAGNEYLATFARPFNENVQVIPTTIDTSLYLPQRKVNREPTVIGWSGSTSTMEHFQFAVPALKEIKMRFGNRIQFSVIGDGTYQNKDLEIQGLPWKFEEELSDLQNMDIGLMPLPDDEWTRGKCGLKALQYMSLGIPCIVSPIGVNVEIIRDSENGFLASSTREWVDKISLLINEVDQRIEMGLLARKTVVEHYSVESQQQKYLDVFTKLLQVS